LYTYDATGNKLQKQVIDSAAGIATTTLYLGGFQYQRRTPMATPSGGTDTLQFMGHEEGRARWAFHKYTTGDSAYGWEYDFMEKDHLGNTRVLLTQERDTANYIATMEDQYRTTEDALFYGIDNCVTSNPGWFPVQPGTPNPNNSIANTDGYSTHIGPSILLKVMSGDNLNIGVNALAFDGVVQPPHSSFQYVLNTLATGLVSQTGAAHGDFTSLTDPSSALYAAVGSFLSSKDTNTTSTPKAYLNWMLLDNRLNYVSGNGQSGAIPLTGLNTMQTLGQTIPISSSGYLYIWVSNESPLWNVFWDNLSVRHISGPMLEENHYYPFGLTMAAISDKAIKSNYAENKYRFNKGSELQNKEFSDGSGLEMYETQLRELDPQLGRWWQLDPKPDSSRSLYAAMGNNPILHNDPHGDTLVFPKADPKFIQTVQHTILGMVNNGVGQNIANLAASNSKVNVVEIGDKDKIGSRYSPKRNTIYWNPNQGIVTTNGTKLSPATLLEHEADHATDNINHPADNANRGLVFAMNYHNAEEARVIQGSEQRTALGMGEIKPGQVTRTDHYASFLIHTEDPLSTTGPLRPIP
jgi:RHS repeat-associated protein